MLVRGCEEDGQSAGVVHTPAQMGCKGVRRRTQDGPIHHGDPIRDRQAGARRTLRPTAQCVPATSVGPSVPLVTGNALAVRQAASIEKDLAQAFVLYKKSAQQGHKEVPTPMWGNMQTDTSH